MSGFQKVLKLSYDLDGITWKINTQIYGDVVHGNKYKFFALISP